MKIDFTKADGIVEVTQTCRFCAGQGRSRDHSGGWILCDQCEGKGKIVKFMTPRGLREILADKRYIHD